MIRVFPSVHCLLAREMKRRKARCAVDRCCSLRPAGDSKRTAIIRGMDMLGYDELARRSFDYFISKYNADGYLLRTGYPLMGNGQHLQTLGEHFEASSRSRLACER